MYTCIIIYVYRPIPLVSELVKIQARYSSVYVTLLTVSVYYIPCYKTRFRLNNNCWILVVLFNSHFGMTFVPSNTNLTNLTLACIHLL